MAFSPQKRKKDKLNEIRTKNSQPKTDTKYLTSFL